MILSALAFSIALASPQDAKPVTLNRVFQKGEKLQYSMVSNLHIEERPYGLQTFMPQDIDMSYKFTTEIREMKADGIAIVHYQRPTMTRAYGDSYRQQGATFHDKLDLNYDLTVSPANQILDEKDLNPPKKKAPIKHDGDGDGGRLNLATYPALARQNPLGGALGQFVNEVYLLALNVGPIDSALDFAPKLPFDEVKVGDTWKMTVSYQPQALKGKDGKQAVQRLDYTYTYKGLVTVNGKQYQRVTASLILKTDLGAFVNQMTGLKPEDTHLKGIPLNLTQTIDYDLDVNSKRTIAAHSTATGGFKIDVTDVPDEAVLEQKLTGKTDMTLIASGMTPATPASGKHGGHNH